MPEITLYPKTKPERALEWATSWPGGIALFLFIAGMWILWPLISTRMIAPFANWSLPNVSQNASTATSNIGMQEVGQTGDMFGGLNTLFAGLAFLGVGIAANYQRLTYRSQEIQLKNLKRQQAISEFEPLFFNLIGLYRELLNAIKISPVFLKDEHMDNGFQKMRQNVKEGFQRAENSPDQNIINDKLVAIKNSYYFYFYLPNAVLFGPLFRVLHQILDLLSSAELSDFQKTRFTSIVRAVIDEQIVLLISLHYWVPEGSFLKKHVHSMNLFENTARFAGPAIHNVAMIENKLIDFCKNGPLEMDVSMVNPA